MFLTNKFNFSYIWTEFLLSSKNTTLFPEQSPNLSWKFVCHQRIKELVSLRTFLPLIMFLTNKSNASYIWMFFFYSFSDIALQTWPFHIVRFLSIIMKLQKLFHIKIVFAADDDDFFGSCQINLTFLIFERNFYSISQNSTLLSRYHSISWEVIRHHEIIENVSYWNFVFANNDAK